VPEGNELGVMLIVAHTTLIVSEREPGQLVESLTVIVTVAEAKAVGVPLNTPPVESVKPAGNVPLVTLNVYGPVPPVAPSVCE
jgi:hypothetical protein